MAFRVRPVGRKQPYITNRAIGPLVSGLVALGHNPAPLLAAAGLAPGALADPDTRVPWNRVLSFIDAAVSVTGDDHLGLHLAEHVPLETLDVHLHATLASNTLGQAYQRLCRYQRLLHETAIVELNVDDGRAELSHRLPGGRAAPRHSAEFLLALWVRVGRLATGVTWVPLQVRFAHKPPAFSGPLAEFFGAPLQFASGANTIVFPAGLLELPCLRADASLTTVLDRHASDRLARSTTDGPFAERARAGVLRGMLAGRLDAASLASDLRMSRRTLHRALAAEGVTYRSLLRQVRHELAARHLSDTRYSIAEVAFLLGFADVSAFHRAFRHWTGQTPLAFRRRAQAGD